MKVACKKCNQLALIDIHLDGLCPECWYDRLYKLLKIIIGLETFYAEYPLLEEFLKDDAVKEDFKNAIEHANAFSPQKADLIRLLDIINSI